jgi:hypothetical protein
VQKISFFLVRICLVRYHRKLFEVTASRCENESVCARFGYTNASRPSLPAGPARRVQNIHFTARNCVNLGFEQ